VASGDRGCAGGDRRALDHAAPWAARGRVAGVSPRPEAVTGEQFVTVTGVINGPNVDEHVVYQRYAVDVENWPSMGALIPVMYSPRNPDNWRVAPEEPPL
jgi:hypothetical protein